MNDSLLYGSFWMDKKRVICVGITPRCAHIVPFSVHPVGKNNCLFLLHSFVHYETLSAIKCHSQKYMVTAKAVQEVTNRVINGLSMPRGR